MIFLMTTTTRRRNLDPHLQSPLNFSPQPAIFSPSSYPSPNPRNPTHPKNLSTLDSLLLTRPRPLDPTFSVASPASKNSPAQDPSSSTSNADPKTPPSSSSALPSNALSIMARSATLRCSSLISTQPLQSQISSSTFVNTLKTRQRSKEFIHEFHRIVSGCAEKLMLGLLGVSCDLSQVVLNEME